MPPNNPATGWLFGFKASRIQRWLLRSGRLRDIMGASQLLESLCGDTFEQVAKAACPEAKVLAAAAGWGRVWVPDEAAARAIHASWSWIVRDAVPGLQVDHGLVPVNGREADAHQQLNDVLRAARNAPVIDLPVATPIMQRNPRTGLPSVAWHRLSHGRGDEPVDRVILARRAAADSLAMDPSRSRLHQRCLGAMDAEFLSGSEGEGAFDQGYIGCVHADGNGIGNSVRTILDKHPGKFADFSRDLANATAAATQSAVAEELVKQASKSAGSARLRLPARPVLLGGDDLTILIAGDIAVRFAQAFLRFFRNETMKLLAPYGFPGGLSACAGVALVKANYPFDRAHALAESLCQRAKSVSRLQAGGRSMLAFHRVTTSLTGDVWDIEVRELTTRDNIRLTFGAYDAEGASTPRLDDLFALAKALDGLPRSSVREVVGLLYDNQQLAQSRWHRLDDVLTQTHGAAWGRAKGLLVRLGCKNGDFTGEVVGNAPRATPLLDALRLSGSRVQRERGADEEGIA
jgi:hypothetical protein